MTQELFVKIDSHAHLASDEMFFDVDEVIARAEQAGVRRVVNITTNLKTLERGILLHEKYPDFIVNTGATTPHDVEEEGNDMFPYFAKAARNGQLVAIGETGLDYYYEHSNRQVQQDFLRQYIALAKETNLPIIIHCRGDEAFTDLFTILKYPKVLLHCFTGSVEQAKEAIARGWYISISGIATFKKSEALRHVIQTIPLNHLLIETDSPYLAPQSKRGQRNEPAFIEEVARTIAQEKNIPLEKICESTVKNTYGFFQLHQILR